MSVRSVNTLLPLLSYTLRESSMDHAQLGGSGRTSLVDDNCHRRVSLQLRVPFSETERVLSLQMALKCADLGHLAQAREVRVLLAR